MPTPSASPAAASAPGRKPTYNDAVVTYTQEARDALNNAKAGATATATATATSSGAKGRDGADTTTTTTKIHPIRTLATPTAQAVRHTHPVLLLSLFLLRFKALVADPVPTLSSALPVLAGLQVAYAVACLPPAGSQQQQQQQQQQQGARKLRPGEKRKDVPGPNVVVTALVALILSALATLPLLAAFVLLGAPLLTHLPHTTLCAAHLSILALFPLLYTRGLGGAAWLAVLSASAPLDEAFGGLIGAVGGAWLGAVPIPLDWDRDWQAWPVTILGGVYAGYVLGKAVGGSPLAFGRRFGSSTE